MSELRWNWVYFPYLDAPNKQEESALKAGYIKVVSKDEADKVIAELENELQAANEQIENLINSASRIMLFQDNVNDNKCAELRHNKYKRCLAIAKWCITEKVYFHYRYDDWGDRGYDRPYKWKKVAFWGKWTRRWLELAEKFKEAK